MRTIVVCGPPGSGKSSYVRKQMKRGDLIIDMDELYRAISGLELRDKPDDLLPFVAHARDALLDKLRFTSDPNRTAWVITTSSDRAYVNRLVRQLKARRVLMDVDANECVRRMRKEGRGKAHVALMKIRCEQWVNAWGIRG